MKNLKKILFLTMALFAFVVSTSCSSDNDDKQKDEEETIVEDFIKFKYKGTEYSFTPEYMTSATIHILGYQGIDDTYKKVSLWMPLDAKVGTYPVVKDLSQMETTYQISFSFLPAINNAYATSGTIKITAINDDKIEGTFSFAGTQGDEAFEVTDGSFLFNKF